MSIWKKVRWALGTAAVLALVAVGCNGGSGGGPGQPKRMDTPANLVASSPESGRVTLAWDAVTGATSYSVYWDTAPGVTTDSPNVIPAATNGVDDTGATNGATHYYVVTALGPKKESLASMEALALPLDFPGGLAAVAGNERVVLTWSPVIGAEAYDVYWSLTPGVTIATGTPLPDGTSPLELTGLTNGTTYHYVVAARNTVGGGAQSSASQAVSATPWDVSGTLDLTFGGQGFVVHDNAAGGNSYDYGYDITTDAQGRVLATGISFNADTPTPDYDMVVWRYTSAGALDTSFDGKGWTTIHDAAGGDDYDIGRALVLDATGRLLVIGGSTGSDAGFDMALWAFAEDAAPDPSLGGTGTVLRDGTAGGSGYDDPFDLVIDAAGRILAVGGSQAPDGLSDLTVWRFLPDGSLDTSFGGTGYATHTGAVPGNLHEYGTGIDLDSSGRIVIAGVSSDWLGDLVDLVVWRFLETGDLDTSFGGQGWVTHDDAAGGSGNDYGEAVVVDSSGRIYAAGRSQNASLSFDMVVWAFTDAGVLDPLFATGGVFVFPTASFGGTSSLARDVTLDPSGRVLATGTYGDPVTLGDVAVWRLTTDGALDPAFGTGGMVTHHNASGGNSGEQGWGIAWDPTAAIYVTGTSFRSGQSDMVIWRFR